MDMDTKVESPLAEQEALVLESSPDSKTATPAGDAQAAGGTQAAGETQIDQASAEAFIAEKRIGERIKRLRLKKSMGLVELGRHTGLSASFLSQLETGRVVPTLRNLARISIVFGKDLAYFFEAEPHAMFRIHRKGERMRLPQSGVDDPTYYFESLGYMVPDRQLDPYYAEFLPQTKTAEARPHVHPGFEFLYVIEGELEIRHAEKTHVVSAGDGVYFDASTPHAYKCHGKAPAVVVIVTMHQQPMQQASAPTRSLGNGTGLRATLSAKAPASSQPHNGSASGEMVAQAASGRRRERPSA